uniref:Sp185/333 n=1 Tax=Strongylocentrotus purpuratus TaxID=7668 RepID=A1DWR5_STRPU|nr:Sp185/333 [Strongylocentrotus purpuratus]ABK88865.1 Sp185/333 [Strongylocentrotus purpuratus]
MVKVTLIVAIVAALAISAHAQRDYNELRGNKNGRERTRSLWRKAGWNADGWIEARWWTNGWKKVRWT